jgi:hypothetical protein
MSDTIPPDTRTPGDAGHIDDHNDIADVLTSLSQSVALLPGTQFTISAAAPTTPGNNDVWFNVSGTQLAVEIWSASLSAWIPTPVSVLARPDDAGLIAANFDVNAATGTTQAVSGRVYLEKLYFRQPRTVSKIWAAIGTAAVTPTANENWAGLISPSGALLSSGQFSSGQLTTVGPAAVSLAAAQAVTTPFAWAAYVFNCATPPFLLTGCPVPSAANANLAATAYQTAVNGSGATVLGNVTPSANSQAGALDIWSAAS